MAIVNIKHDEGKIVCTFLRSMDTAQCLEAEKEVMKAAEGVEKIIFDLSGVEYIASSFLRFCAKVSHKISIENFSITNVTPAVKKIFTMVGVAKIWLRN